MKTNDDYEDFKRKEDFEVPQSLTTIVLSTVHSSLNPSHKIIYSKLFCIQLFMGIISMLFCPQFELSLTNNHDLFHFFHRTFGAKICMIICGAIFMGSGAIFSSSLLTFHELKKIYNSKYLYFTSLSGVFISLFSIYKTEVFLQMALLWIIGSILSAIFIFKLTYSLRLTLREVNSI